jgi:hypothetical protein
MQKHTLQGGKVLQTVSALYAELATVNTAIPADDTIPQITEGGEIMSLAITPKNALSYLEICAVINGAINSDNHYTAALFVVGTNNAIAVNNGGYFSANTMTQIVMSIRIPSVSVTARTYKIRVGNNDGSTMSFNGKAGGRIYGGTTQSSIIIREVLL